MERKRGEIFEYNGEWYQCIVKGFNCTDCDIKDCPNIRIGACSSHLRNDGRQVKFKKLEKVGGIYIAYGKVRQKYKLHAPLTITNGIINKDISCDDVNGIVDIEIKQEDMEEKNNGNTPLNVLMDKYVNGDICYDDFEKEVKALYSCKEEIKPTLKPFDLEAAKQGKPVCTRDGRKVRIICFDKKKDIYPLIALVTDKDGYEIITPYKADGVHPTIPNDDLMMLPEKKEGYILLSKDDCVITDEEIAKKRCTDGYFVAKVSWEV